MSSDGSGSDTDRPSVSPHNSNASTTTVNSSSSSSYGAEIRCSRCQITASETTGMVCFAINSFYCPRCASIVGYGG